MTKRMIQTYLKRTEKLLERWKTVPKDHVDLDTVAYCSGNLRKGKQFPTTRKELTMCGSVGCLAGWANTWMKHRSETPGEILYAMDEYYGTHYIHWEGPDFSTLFGHKKLPGVSSWREAKLRLESRIRQLKAELKEIGA